MLLRHMLKTTKLLLLLVLLGGAFLCISTGTASASRALPPGGTPGDGSSAITPCGEGDTAYTPSIDLGCKGKGNSIMDLAFAIIRFISYGVGLLIVGSLTYAGIQYTASRGDPNAVALAIKRIQSNIFALLLFIFAFAIVNYLVPGALLK